MDNILKQRLVGALILVALGVVFWPIIFVEPKEPERSQEIAIPARPQVDKTPIEPPDQVGLRPSGELESREQLEREDRARELLLPAPLTIPTPGQPGDSASVASKAAADPAPKTTPGSRSVTAAAAVDKPATEVRTRKQAPVTPQIDAEGVPVAWILQVITVSKEEKAEELRLRLIAMGYKAYARKVRRSDRSLYRVYVGPGFEKARIESIKPAVDAELSVDSVVQRYLP